MHLPRGEHTLHVATLGEGPAVVCSHGLLVGSLASWYFTLGPALASAHQVVMYDQRGHGRSSPVNAGFDLATLRQDLGAVADHAGGVVDLVGHSYGGLVALSWAAAHPERVRRLVLVDAPLPPSPDLLGNLEVGHPDELLDMLPEPLKLQVQAGGRRARRMLATLGRLVAGSLFADLKAEAPLPDGLLSTVLAPTLLVYGEHSACLPDGRHLAQHLPHASLHTLPTGHFIPVEAPERLIPLIVEHLDG